MDRKEGGGKWEDQQIMGNAAEWIKQEKQAGDSMVPFPAPSQGWFQSQGQQMRL